MKQRSLPDCGPLVGVVPLTAALWVLYHELREYHDHDVRRPMEEHSPSHLLFALAEVRRTKVELTEDPWYDVEENSAPTIRTWIQAYNDTVTHYGKENSSYIVTPLPPPQT